MSVDPLTYFHFFRMFRLFFHLTYIWRPVTPIYIICGSAISATVSIIRADISYYEVATKSMANYTSIAYTL